MGWDIAGRKDRDGRPEWPSKEGTSFQVVGGDGLFRSPFSHPLHLVNDRNG